MADPKLSKTASGLRPVQKMKMSTKTLKSLSRGRGIHRRPRRFRFGFRKIAGLTDAKALHMTGYGTVASHPGYPDAWLATYTDMLDRAAAIASLGDRKS